MRKTHTEIHLRNEPKHGHKEYKYLYQQMLKDDVIRKAYKKLRKGKTKRKEIQYIDAHLDDEVQKMYDMILNTKPEVQIVCRLIQKQNIRLLQEELSHQHFGSLATA